jgi:hypothetical protein
VSVHYVMRNSNKGMNIYVCILFWSDLVHLSTREWSLGMFRTKVISTLHFKSSFRFSSENMVFPLIKAFMNGP